MKNLLLILVMLSTLHSFGQNPIDRIGVVGPLNFNKTAFNLSWSDKPSETYYIQEYLPAGEQTANFKQLLTLHLFNKDIPLKNAVDQKIQELVNRKKTDAICNYAITQKNGGKEYMVDFLLSESKGNKMTIVEFNIYRYISVDLGKGKKGVLVYAYSKRSYGNDIDGFLKTIKTDRTALLNVMAVSQIPIVTIR